MAHSCLITTMQLLKHLADLKANGCDFKIDHEVGIATGFDGGDKVLAAVQKHRKGPWIASFIDAGRISWNPPPKGR